MAQEEYPGGVTSKTLAESAMAIGRRLHQTGDKHTAVTDLVELAETATTAGHVLAAAQLRAAARVDGPPSRMRRAIGATVHALQGDT